MAMTCPCGKGESLETCCGPIMAGKVLPDTAENLMRARYTAYATGNVDFILSSHDPETAGEVDRANTEAWSKSAEWLGLEITNTEAGQAATKRAVWSSSRATRSAGSRSITGSGPRSRRTGRAGCS